MEEPLRYATATIESGMLLLVASSRGVCLVRFGNSKRDLQEQLRREFPCATYREATDKLEPWLCALERAAAGCAPSLVVPLDVRGSCFQCRVWRALRDIPAGETRSYQALARTLGMPGGARAVARACATNPVPLLVPCHRVVRADGSPGGYLGGTARKRELLRREEKRASTSDSAPTPGPRTLQPLPQSP